MSESLLILTLTTAVMYGVHVSATPPVVVKDSQTAFIAEKPRVLLICLRALDISSSVISLIEILLLSTYTLAINLPGWPFITHLHHQVSTALFMSPGQAISATPIRSIAGLAIITGSLVRWWCYRVMGQHFTFQVTVLKSHTLITTGPYSLVRHPSYFGGILQAIALPFWHAARGGWLCENNLAQGDVTAVRCAAIVAFVVFGAPVAWVTARRAAAEDALMREKFGKTWEQWASKVPYKFLPGIV